MPRRFTLGIDLGTTHSVLAFAPLDAIDAGVDSAGDPAGALAPRAFALPQLVAPATVERRTLLPSFLYLAAAGEEDALALPWSGPRDFAVGELARRRSAEAPARTVAAAKSWLTHHGVDRRAPILPWSPGAAPEAPRISPLDAQQRYLEHLRDAWDAAHPDARLAEQRVVLTVPASFDASARELTREAAAAAGFPDDLVLLEEPQAAVYAWLADRGEAWRRDLAPGDRLLVVDVGGGTTDLTLVGVDEADGELRLERLAVGEHLLVGGDNMDLAVAHLAQRRLAERGVEVDAWQSVALWHSCRAAKEALLAPDGPASHPVTVLGRGSRLVGGTVSVELHREEVAALLLDGFFPVVGRDERPARRGGSGFRELGLPYETEVAVTRHLAAFLAGQGDADLPSAPTHLLLNGGVFRSALLHRRLAEVLASWQEAPPRPLRGGGDDLEHAVARGAAYYGWVQEGHGVRIRGGTARAYYLGIESAGLAVPGAPRPLRALCVVPHGMEEGSEHAVPAPPVGLVVGEPATFRFFASTTRKEDRPGDLLDRWESGELVETDPLLATLPPAADSEDGFVPVRLVARVSELGQLELWCHSTLGEERWKMEFSVREER